MKVILITDVKKQGKKGDVLEVKDGYGQFLIKNKSAVLASSYGLNRLNKENEKAIQDENLKINQAEKLKSKIEKEKITFKVKTGTGDRVFGIISAKQILESLNSLGYKLDKKQIKIDGTISSLGHHIVSIELHKKVIAKIDIELVK